jgi:hypothetical protein
VARLLAKPLAKWGDPYITLDGKVVSPDAINGGIDESVPKINLAEYKPSKKRTIRELPAPVPTLKGIACVFMFTTLGLGDREIADALGISVEQMKGLKGSPAYAECFEAVTSEFISVNSELINARIAAYSHDALSEIANVALRGKEERNRLRGSMYLMGAGGYGDKSKLAGNAAAKNDLRIVIIGKDQDVRIEGV